MLPHSDLPASFRSSGTGMDIHRPHRYQHCLRSLLGMCVQTDLKYINAYSSVSHCGMVLFAILMLNNKTAMTGGILQMLSHGLGDSSLFFALIGMI